MHYQAIRYFLGYSLEDWVAILTIIGIVIASVRWLNAKVKTSVKSIEDNLLGPIRDELNKLNRNMQISNRQYEKATQRLEDGDKKFIRHDEQLQDHERRITNLEAHNESNK